MQLDMFPDLCVKRKKTSKEYGAFTNKFKVKLTTDDCYTPEPVYNAVRDWVVDHFHLEGRKVVRPFWPGADFETYDYQKDDVVIDNPPFSIYDHILDFYTSEKIDFFIFGPSLTLFKKYDCCYIVTNETVTYANGAKVNTSFVTNLDKINRIATYRELKEKINEAEHFQKQKKEDLHIFKYPNCIVTSAILGKTSRVDFFVKKTDCEWCPKINGERLFGGGFLLSDRAAADRKAARKTIIRKLGSEEEKLLEKLNA